MSDRAAPTARELLREAIPSLPGKEMPEIPQSPLFCGRCTNHIADVVLKTDYDALRTFTADLLAALSALEGRAGWVAVTERLPEHGALVLVWNGEIETVATYDGDPDPDNCPWIDRISSCADLDDQQVTHWQPLPAPPISPATLLDKVKERK